MSALATTTTETDMPATAADDGGEIVPFGKYRGQPVTHLLADRGYVDWLKGQPWLEQKQPTIYNVIVGAGGPEPQDTPEHNAMQARYLDDDLCRRLARRYLPDREQMLQGARERRERHASDEQRANIVEGGEEYSLVTSPAEFEVYGWDVVYRAVASVTGPQERTHVPKDPTVCPWCQVSDHSEDCREVTERHRGEGRPDSWLRSDGPVAECSRCWPRWHREGCPGSVNRGKHQSAVYPQSEAWDDWCSFLGGARAERGLRVELKPTIGDDYPTVLRQVLGRLERDTGFHRDSHRAVVVTDHLGPSSVTAEQVRSIFERRGVDLVLSREIA